MSDLFDSCLLKVNSLKLIFSKCTTLEKKYQKVMELGRQHPALDSQFKIPENLVKGCQSLMYLHSEMHDNKVIFKAESDALISAGLAALLIKVYSGETPEVILQYPPDFLKDLGIVASLTPGRANGLYNIHLKMKQDALKLLITSQFRQGI
jgi:cysteine desulfuration protein SufE